MNSRHAILALASAACLAQCSAPNPAAPAQAEPTNVAISSLADVRGQWDIVSFGDYRPARLDHDGQRHAFVTIANDGLSFAIECNFSGMRGEIADGDLNEIGHDATQTEMGCGREREARDAAFFAFFRDHPTLTLAGDDTLVLETNNTRLELQRAEARQREFLIRSLADLEGRWTAQIVYFQTAPGESSNLLAELEGGATHFQFAGDRATMSVDCERVAATLQLNSPGQVESQASAFQRQQTGRCLSSQADRDKVTSLIRGHAEIERIGPDAVHVVAGPIRAVLIRA